MTSILRAYKFAQSFLLSEETSELILAPHSFEGPWLRNVQLVAFSSALAIYLHSKLLKGEAKIMM
jgi:hypothetical protein